MQGPRKGKMKSSPKAKTIAKHPKSRPGLNYGNDGLIKKIINGKEVWVEKHVHPTKT